MVLVSAILAAAGCGGSTAGEVDDFPSTVRLRIDTQGGQFEGRFPVELNANLDPVTPLYQLAFGAGNGHSMSWGAFLLLSRDQALAGHARVPITTSGLSEGQGSVRLQGSTQGAPLAFATGTLEVSFGANPSRTLIR